MVSVLLIGVGVGWWLNTQTGNLKLLPILNQPNSTGSPALVSEMSREKARVKRVVDGDTIELTDGRKLRYIGIDTPETVDPNRPSGCFGKEASNKNKELVENKEIELEKDVSETDKFGRLLRYVYLTDTEMVNEKMVRDGYAFARTYPPDVKYQEKLRQAEADARTNNRGLWASCSSDGKSAAASIEPLIIGEVTNIKESPNVAGVTTNGNNTCLIKGNISGSGNIYHLPGCGSYDKTVINETAGERWFCTEAEAVQAGWRKAKNC